MRATVLRTQTSAAARRPGRLILTGLAILVASFVVFGTVLVQQITERTVRDNLSGTPAATDLVIGDFDHAPPTVADLERVRAVPGVAEAVSRVSIGVSIGEGYLNLQADPGTGPLTRVRVVEGSYPDAPGEIAVTPRTAERLGLPVGATTSGTGGELITPARLTVTGLVDSAADAGYDAYAPDTVVTSWGRLTGLERVDVRVAPGTSTETVRQQVVAAVAGQPIRTGAQVRQAEANAAAEEVGRLFILVGMFVSIAVVAAALVVTSTFRIVFAQRMRQLALLRAVGADRGALVGAMTAEGALTGLVMRRHRGGQRTRPRVRAAGHPARLRHGRLLAGSATGDGGRGGDRRRRGHRAGRPGSRRFRPPGSPRWRHCGRRAPPPAGAASGCSAWCSGCSWQSARCWPPS